MSKNPRGPLLENNIKTTSPTTTEGIPIKVYVNLENILFPLKLDIPRKIPKGIKIKEAIIVADVDTTRDKKIILYISGSKDIINLKASIKPSIM